MASNTITVRVYEFLKNYPPFNLISKENLRFISERVRVQYFEPGQLIFSQGDSPKDCFFIVNQGSVKLVEKTETHSRLIDVCDEGDVFGVRAMIANRPYLTTAVADEDCLLFAIPSNDFHPLIGENSRLAMYFAAGFASGQPVIRPSMQETNQVRIDFSTGSNGITTFRMNDILMVPSDKKLVSCNEDTLIKEVGEKMSLLDIGSMVVLDEDRHPCGIITDTDFRTKVVTGKVKISEPVKKIMNRPVVTIAPLQPVSDVMLKMMRQKVNHLCITADGTENSEALGIVSQHDLLLMQGNHPSTLLKEIHQAKNIKVLQTLRNRADNLLKMYLEQEVSINYISDYITEINDAVSSKAIVFAAKELEEAGLVAPKYKYCWLALGSEGREEKLIRTDQNNALIFEDPASENEYKVREYYIDLGKKANEILLQCGFENCPDMMMASNPIWCMPLREYKKRFHDWIHQPDCEELKKIAVFFDYRYVTGEKSLKTDLTKYIYQQIDKEDRFLQCLASNSLLVPPPLSFFRDYLIERGGEHKEEFDIKLQAMKPLADAARTLYLANRLSSSNNTFKRFKELAEIDAENSDLYNEASISYEILMRFRAVNGLKHNSSGRCIIPANLNKIERQTLRNAFKPIAEIQELLKLKF